AEFDRKILETLRQPIEDGYVNISRVKYSAKYPCRVLLVAAMNSSILMWINGRKNTRVFN
ncbi:ATP-binding protein, partial [Clostridioides difficile]